jgi:hypothetical protein
MRLLILRKFCYHCMELMLNVFKKKIYIFFLNNKIFLDIEPTEENKKIVPRIEKSGQIRFKKDIDIRGGGKRLRKKKGDLMYIWDFAHKMRRIDNRFMITGEKLKSEHIFRFLVDGHAMLTLLTDDGKEEARCMFFLYLIK